VLFQPTNTRSKSKEDVSRSKKDATPVELRTRQEGDKKSRPADASDKKGARPAGGAAAGAGASADKRAPRPSPASDRKTVRSLTAEFEKKAAARPAPDKADADKKAPDDKKARPGPTAVAAAAAAAADRRAVKTPTSDTDKPDKKVRAPLPAEPERKKVRPSLTANPEKKKVDTEKRGTICDRPDSHGQEQYA